MLEMNVAQFKVFVKHCFDSDEQNGRFFNYGRPKRADVFTRFYTIL